MARVLVTGGLGFIGSELVRQLIAMGHSVVNIDAMTYAANPANLRSVEDHPLYAFRNFNLKWQVLVEDVLRDQGPFDIVFHLAAHSHVDNSISGPSIFVENIDGTQVLLEAWRKITIEEQGHDSLFLYMSTDEVMGDLPLGDGSLFTSSSPINPSSPYSASKAGGELICRAYARTYDLPIVCVRSSNAYGPYQHVEKLIPKAITNLLARKPVPVYGVGANVRDWIFVEDLVEALIYIGSRGWARDIDMPTVVNVGSSNEVTNISLVSTIIESMWLVPGDYIEFVQDRPGHDLRYAIDTSELNSLGWSASTKLKDGLTKTINWYTENKDWWNNEDKN